MAKPFFSLRPCVAATGLALALVGCGSSDEQNNADTLKNRDKAMNAMAGQSMANDSGYQKAKAAGPKTGP